MCVHDRRPARAGRDWSLVKMTIIMPPHANNDDNNEVSPSRLLRGASLITSFPADRGSTASKTPHCIEVKRLIKRNASANELSFNADQVRLHEANRAIASEGRLNRHSGLR